MRILLVTPPLTQLNTPYPATPYIAGFLASKNIEVDQLDLGIELIDKLFTAKQLAAVFASVEKSAIHAKSDARMLAIQNRYISTIDSVINFLRGNDASIANRIVKRNFLPEGERFKDIADLEYSFGEMGIVDQAKYFSTLYIQDISDFIRRNISPYFELIRYAESLCAVLPTFDSLREAVEAPLNLIDTLIVDLFKKKIEAFSPDIVGFSIPFPGNLYGGLICGKWLKSSCPSVKILMGGGYVNTELRNISDSRLFSYIDYLLFDDGELPILRLVEFIEGKVTVENLIRTKYIAGNRIVSVENTAQNISKGERSTPIYNQLPIRKYMDLVDTANPMLKLWSDGRWNKLILAHGCYWAKCAFCDVTLDYISRFEPYDVGQIVDMMQNVMGQTGQSGFHFVDEAAPPALLKKISLEIIKRGLVVSWWANVRFERSFTTDLCRLMARAGCIAVSGGLEVASDRLLKKMDKGVDIRQTANVTKAFSDSGILVHAYLMYGFPTETTQETIDSLEVVRQLFEQDLIQSAFWHRFAMTLHSPVGCDPNRYGAKALTSKLNPFANNEVYFEDGSNTDLDMLGDGLKKATYNYMHGLGFDDSVYKWFDVRVPKTTLPSTLIQGYLITDKHDVFPEKGAYVWLADGYQLILTDSRRPKLHIFNNGKQVEVILKLDEIAFWENFFAKLDECDGFLEIETLKNGVNSLLYGGVRALLGSKVWKTLRKNGLILV